MTADSTFVTNTVLLIDDVTNGNHTNDIYDIDDHDDDEDMITIAN